MAPTPAPRSANSTVNKNSARLDFFSLHPLQRSTISFPESARILKCVGRAKPSPIALFHWWLIKGKLARALALIL